MQIILDIPETLVISLLEKQRSLGNTQSFETFVTSKIIGMLPEVLSKDPATERESREGLERIAERAYHLACSFTPYRQFTIKDVLEELCQPELHPNDVLIVNKIFGNLCQKSNIEVIGQNPNSRDIYRMPSNI